MLPIFLTVCKMGKYINNINDLIDFIWYMTTIEKLGNKRNIGNKKWKKQ